ncbi:hypothetical protein, partial [Plasmodium yoelii yoelii]
MFLYLMKHLFSKTCYLHHIYFDSNCIFTTEHFNCSYYLLFYFLYICIQI